MWEGAPDTSAFRIKVETLDPASRLPAEVGFFWVFPYKTGIRSRRSMSVHRNQVGKVIRQFMCVK
jgi:hypothetical protein